jgi:hypothetical protein
LGYYADGRRINPPGVKSFAEVRHLESIIFIGFLIVLLQSLSHHGNPSEIFH